MIAGRALTWVLIHHQKFTISDSVLFFKKLLILIYTNMKKIRIYILLSFALVIVSNTGCKKLLEEKPKAIASLGELDPVLLEQTVIGVYEPMTRSRGRLWESTVGLGFELMSEYADGGPTQVNWSNYNNVMNSPNSLSQPWTTLYEAIGRANLLIANLDISTNLKKKDLMAKPIS